MILNSICVRSVLLAVAVVMVAEPAVEQNALAEENLVEPVYREAVTPVADAAVATTPVAPAVQASVPTTQTEGVRVAFDLRQQPGEHPLVPVIRIAKESLQYLDQNIRDYTCRFVKRERLEGELGEYQYISMKVLSQPFSVYMLFMQPFPKREVLYVDGQRENEIVVLEAGWKRKLGQFHLDPTGAMAMQGQKYPITNVGIRNLLSKYIQATEAETQFGESEVTTNPDTKIDGRPTTMIQIVHPVPRNEFRSHISRIFFDNELRIPIHYDAFLWPEAGQQPPLEESYTYRDLKVNVGLTAAEFDPENPTMFNP